MIATRARSRHDLPIVVALAAVVLWSAGNVLARASSLPGPQLAFWRTLCGAVVYQAVFRARGGNMTFATLRRAAVGGFGFGLSASLFFTALKETSVANATVIAALQPILLLPVGVRLYGDRISTTRLVMVLAAVSGTVMVVIGASSTGEAGLAGDVLAFLATVAGCLYFVGTKSARETLDTLEYQAAALVVAATVALPAALLVGGGFVVPRGGQWWWPVVMTALPGTGHLMMTWAQRSLSVAATSTIALSVVVYSSIGAVIFFDQPLSVLQLLGIAVVLAALALFVRGARERIDPLAEEV